MRRVGADGGRESKMRIGEVAGFLRDRMEESLQAEEPRPEGWVVLSNLREADGTVPAGLANKLALSLTSIQEDPGLRNRMPQVAGGRPAEEPPLVLCLTVTSLFGGCDYVQGLDALSRIVSFVTANPILGVGECRIELMSLNFQEQLEVTEASGLRGLPFVMIRIRGT